MYFFKFVSWFWNDHLDGVESRFGFTIIGLLLGLGPVSIAAWFFGGIMYLWYFGGLLALVFIIGAYNFVAFVHCAYVKWQAQVFNKLRGDEQQKG